MRLWGLAAIASRVATSYAKGSTSLILQVSISEAMRAQLAVPSS